MLDGVNGYYIALMSCVKTKYTKLAWWSFGFDNLGGLTDYDFRKRQTECVLFIKLKF